jgi:hypothetical protein
MIETKNLVPSVYYDKSRDFQLLSKTYDIVFNYLRTNIETIHNNPLNNNSDLQLIDLLTYTLGFKPKHKYNTQQLISICSSLMLILRNKGNTNSIRYVLDALLRAEGIASVTNSTVTTGSIFVDNTKNCVYIYCPEGLSDTVLLNDLLDYILPAGMSYSIVKQTKADFSFTGNELISNDTISHEILKDKEESIVPTFDSTIIASDTKAGRIDNSSVVYFSV